MIVIGEKIVEVNNHSGIIRVTLVDRKVTEAKSAEHGLLKGKTPYTGDNAPLVGLSLLALSAAAGIVVLLYTRKKR